MKLYYSLVLTFKLLLLKSRVSKRISIIMMLTSSLSICIYLVISSLFNTYNRNFINKYTSLQFDIQSSSYIENSRDNDLIFSNIKNYIKNTKYFNKFNINVFNFTRFESLINTQEKILLKVMVFGVSNKFFQNLETKKNIKLLCGNYTINKLDNIVISKQLFFKLYKNNSIQIVNDINSFKYPSIELIVLKKNIHSTDFLNFIISEDGKLNFNQYFSTINLKVTGVLDTDKTESNSNIIFTRLENINKMNNHYFNYTNSLGILINKNKNNTNIRNIVNRLNNQFPFVYNSTLKDINYNTFYALEWQKSFIILILVLVVQSLIFITVYLSLDNMIISYIESISILYVIGNSYYIIYMVFILYSIVNFSTGSLIGILSAYIILAILVYIISIINLIFNILIYIYNNIVYIIISYKYDQYFIDYNIINLDLISIASIKHYISYEDIAFILIILIISVMIASFLSIRRNLNYNKIKI